MKKSIILSLIVLSAFQLQIFAQCNKSIQVNGGLMSATDSDKGVLGTAQFNYVINSSLTLYAYSGIIYWNNNKVSYYPLFYADGKGYYTSVDPINTFTEDNHKMIPLYIGGRYFFNNSAVFKPFVNLEIGFNYLTFNHYNLEKVTQPDESQTIQQSSKTEQIETLFGAGLGLGACHDIGNNLELLLEFRFNTLKNSNYEWFSPGKTLTSFQFGFAYKI